MLCMYMGGVVTKLDIPSGGNRLVKEFKHLRVKDGLESLIIHGQCIDGVHVSYFIMYGNNINFISKHL